jgi:chromosome partitioning protein
VTVEVVATYSIKGGVGKTTAAVNLAFEAAQSGARVLLWDLDPQGAATFFFRVKPRVRGGVDRLVGRTSELAAQVKESDVAGLHVVPADFSLRHLDLRLDDRAGSTQRLAELLAPLSGTYDVALLDCAPSISLTSEAVFRASNALLVPTIPTTLSVRTLGQLTHFLDGRADVPTILPFVSMLDRRKALHRLLVESLDHVEPRFLSAAIPNASVVERMATRRAPLGEVAPRSAARKAFTDLWHEVAENLWPP